MTTPPPDAPSAAAPSAAGPVGLDHDRSVPEAFRRLHGEAMSRLRCYPAVDAEQEACRARFVALLDADPGAVWRDGPAAHLTAGVLVLDATGQRVLLTHHRKGRQWFHLGGHLEPGDADLPSAARREAREESGIADLELQPGILQLSSHRLSRRYGRCREHFDARYLAYAPTDAQPVVSQESYDVRWWALDELPSTAGSDLPGLIASARRR